ncbi:hypothetical protein HQ571_06200 [Candidatus Kuenenbacteria bacterium]|nr:hypothetical protein [Candidatus Kuenenbacteria bacterium]
MQIILDFEKRYSKVRRIRRSATRSGPEPSGPKASSRPSGVGSAKSVTI